MNQPTTEDICIHINPNTSPYANVKKSRFLAKAPGTTQTKMILDEFSTLRKLQDGDIKESYTDTYIAGMIGAQTGVELLIFHDPFSFEQLEVMANKQPGTTFYLDPKTCAEYHKYLFNKAVLQKKT